MDHYAGIDVSVQSSSVCVVDATGKIIREGKVASEGVALVEWFSMLGVKIVRVGLEAGPLSQWLYAHLRQAGLAVELLETRHVNNAFKTMPVKTDRKDARGIAELVRLGWFRPVHCKSIEAQETRAVLTARKLVQSKLHDVEMCLRGVLRNFGLKVGKTTPRDFPFRIKELVAGNPILEGIAEALLRAREALLREFNGFERQVRRMARANPRARLLMTTPSIGPLVSLTYASAIDDPSRFRSSKQVGPYFGLTPRKYQSGEIDINGRISKMGDDGVREALYQAAHVLLTRSIKGGALKSWAMRLAKRAGMQRAKAALARKLAVIMHRMLVDGKPFDFAAAAA
ncbi:MAG: IS110 family transposase [Hyphomicrobiales bacterium]|nr:IS110 family transposase [Hyphomicrobiales bacterium]